MNAKDYIQKLGHTPHPEFELAKKEELLHAYPQHKVLIERMCR